MGEIKVGIGERMPYEDTRDTLAAEKTTTFFHRRIWIPEVEDRIVGHLRGFGETRQDPHGSKDTDERTPCGKD